MKRQSYTLTVTPEMHDMIRSAYDWTVCGNGPMYGDVRRLGGLVCSWT